MKKVTVFTIPGKLKNNPYLDLLTREISGKESGAFQFESKPFTARALIAQIFSAKPSIVHIHWETNIYGSRYWLYSVFKLATRFPLLFLAKWCGVKFVWTMHNSHAHEYPFKTLDALGRDCMRKLAHVIIIQNREACAAYAKKYPQTKFFYIPHGNYISAYRATHEMSRAEVRNEWGIPQKSIVLLALGAIRPYKRLEILIEKVRGAVAQTPSLDLVLVIAGKGESAYVEKLQKLSGDSSAIRIIPEFVADARVPEFFAAADYAIFAYGESSLTSGALLLALSYETPVITLEMPAAEIIQEGINGFVRKNPEELQALFMQLAEMPKHDPERVVATVRDFSWERVGKDTCALYASLYTR